ncbi:hypothetical protein BGZ57DRAFT_972142 [Hyaloscypha finlandica]|nr:hypothetical protein BGZ57DRAFT_972142 [Hyaloscypha finlandica]
MMADSPTDYNGYQLVAVAITFLILTYISVGLRCFVRIRITRVFAVDDWIMLVAQLIFTLSCAFILRGIHYGIGRHNSELTVSNEIEGLKYQAFATLSYVANMMFIKLSIALFLLRIAVKRLYVWILRISMAVVTIWSLAIWIYELFQCIPVEAQWNYTIKNAKCDSGPSFVAAAYSISVMTIVTDWLYALLPIPMIWSVQMSVQTKMTVAFILSLGIFASVATLIRLRYIIELTDISDILHSGTTAMVWTLVEPGVAITAACLVTMRPLLRALKFPGFESDPAAQHTPLTLRNDISGGHWSTISSHGKESHSQSGGGDGGHKRNFSLTALERLNGLGRLETGVERDGGSGADEGSMDESGITKTVQVRVEHDHASKVVPGPLLI